MDAAIGLKAKAFRGVKWTTFSTAAGVVIQLAQLSILTRLLKPGDFGLMALAMVVIGFSQAFVDMGISNAIIQKQQITQEQLSTLYWLNVLAGIGVFALILLASPLVARFYHEAKLVSILFLVGLTFVIQPLGQQYRVIMQKELRFDAMVKVEIATKLLGLGASVWFAVHGFGVYALVNATLITAIFSTLWFIALGYREHRPKLYFRPSEVRGFLGFGAYQMGEQSVNYISAHIDKILIGRLVGMEALGFYNLAWQLVMFPIVRINSILNVVAFPVYSKIQHDKKEIARYYSLSLHLLSAVLVPFLIFMAFFSHEIILIFYGKAWEQASTLLSILSVVGITKALGNPGGSVVLALGRADIGFWWNVGWATSVALGLTISLLLKPDITITAYTLLVLCLFSGWFWFYIVSTLATAKALPTLMPIVKVAVFAFFLALGISISFGFLPTLPVSMKLIVAALMFATIYFLYMFLYEQTVYRMITRRRN
jgi:O-antigen/teichoic acid export membrane protein